MTQKVIVRTSERTTFMRCRQRWYWAYEDRLTPNVKAVPLRFGDLVHQALAEYYRPGIKRGPKPHITFTKKYLAAQEHMLIRDEDDEWMDALDLGNDMLKRYVEHWKDEDTRYKIVCPEMPFEIDVHDPDTEKYLYTYVGVLDAVIFDRLINKFGFFEHKTTKSISTNHLSMDEQNGSYWAYGPTYLRHMGHLKPGDDLGFVLYNFLRKAKGDTRPQNDKGQRLNKDGAVSRQQPAAYFGRNRVYRAAAEQVSLMDRVKDQVREMRLIRSGKLKPVKSILNGCTGMFSCEFRDMCELHEAGGDWETFRKVNFTTWNPYEQHGIPDSRAEEE